MSENETKIFENDNGAWMPRNYLPSLDKGHPWKGGGIFGGDLKLTNTHILFTGRDGRNNVKIPLNNISSINEAELGFGRDTTGNIGGICITHKDGETTFKVSDQKKWLMELERSIGKGTSVDMDMMETDSSNSELKNTCKRCNKIWYLDADELQDLENRLRTVQGAMQTMGRVNLFTALFDPSLAAQGTTTMAANTSANKSLADELNTKSRCPECNSRNIERTLVDGDQVTKTEIKDSVVSKSNIGSGGDDKLTKIKELKELHDAGAIDDDEFKQMKKEILGK
jgi:hypothetical protein